MQTERKEVFHDCIGIYMYSMWVHVMLIAKGVERKTVMRRYFSHQVGAFCLFVRVYFMYFPCSQSQAKEQVKTELR